jgi:hypothetical protein
MAGVKIGFSGARRAATVVGTSGLGAEATWVLHKGTTGEHLLCAVRTRPFQRSTLVSLTRA